MFTGQLLRIAHEVFGIDVSETALARARARNPQQNFRFAIDCRLEKRRQSIAQLRKQPKGLRQPGELNPPPTQAGPAMWVIDPHAGPSKVFRGVQGGWFSKKPIWQIWDSVSLKIRSDRLSRAVPRPFPQ
ncbi:MAG: hypothetical protein ACE5JS_11390 [Nitrospinota bacterium]